MSKADKKAKKKALKKAVSRAPAIRKICAITDNNLKVLRGDAYKVR